MVKGYWTIVGAKSLQPVDETFCSLPIDGTNCCYLDYLTFEASAAQREPVKGRSGDGGPVASSMIKSAKDEEESLCSWNSLPSPRGGSS